MRNMMLSCSKATELISKKDVVRLTLKERTMLWMHTRLCALCRNYEKQSALIDRVLRKQANCGEEMQHTMISNDDLKNRIVHKLDQQ